MAENQSAVSEVMQKGMKAASTVKGAVNLGKSIAAAAKGGSSGGWIGALAALAWENRRLVAAIIAGVTVIFLLPVIVVSMLPSIIFGGTGSAFSPSDISTPILNSPTVITENMETVTSSVNNVFNEGLTAILQVIEEDMVLDDEVDDQIAKDTIVHELLHTIPGCLTHKGKWRLHAEYVNKTLPQYSIKRAFKGDEGGLKIERKKPVYKYILRYTKCGAEIKRQKETKVVTNYTRYRCGKCGGSLEKRL